METRTEWHAETMPQCIPTWEYVADEIAARGWTVDRLAIEMGGDVDLNLCCLQLLETGDPRLHLNEVAEGFARAFDTDAQTWLFLDDAYRRCMAGHPQLVTRTDPA